jgi:hypothetical protein
MQQGTVHGLSTYTRSSSTNNSDSSSDSSIGSNSSNGESNGAARRTPKANMERPRETINSEARSSLIGPCPVVFSLCDSRLHPRRATGGLCFGRWRRRWQQRPCGGKCCRGSNDPAANDAPSPVPSFVPRVSNGLGACRPDNEDVSFERAGRASLEDRALLGG